MKTRLLFFLSLFISTNLTAQIRLVHCKHYADSIKALTKICNGYLNEENYSALLPATELGLNFIKPNDHSNVSLFQFFRASGYPKPTEIKERLVCLNESLRHAVLARDTNRILQAQGVLMDTYTESGSYPLQQSELAKQMEFELSHTQNDKFKLLLLAPLANYYDQLGLYETEINHRSLQIALLKKRKGTEAENNADNSNIGVGLYSIGHLYVTLENAEKAKEYFKEALRYFDNYKLGAVYTYKDLSGIFLKEQNLPMATEYLDSARQLAQSGTAEAWSQVVAGLLDFSSFYISQNQSQNAKNYLSQAQQLLLRFPDELMQILYNYVQGSLLKNERKYREALPFLLSAEPGIAQVNIDMKLNLFQDLAGCYAGLGDWEKACQYFEWYAPLRDSVYKIASKQSLANAEAKFQNKEKQQQIEAKNAALEFNKRQKRYLLLGLVLMAMVISVLVVYYRNKKRTAELLDRQNKQLEKLNLDLEQANETKAKLFSIIGHDLRSPINQVYQFLKLQQKGNALISNEEKEELSQKIQGATGALLETMEDLLLWSKTQLNSFSIHLQPVPVIEQVHQALELMQLNTQAKSLVIQNEVPEQLLVNTDPYFLQIIFRNLLQNAVKASPIGSTISIAALTGENGISITNEGASFTQKNYEEALTDNNQSIYGLGLKLVDELSRKTGTVIHFETPGPGSTTVVMTFH